MIKITLVQAIEQMIVGDEFKFCGAGDMRVVCVSLAGKEKNFRWIGFKSAEFTVSDYLNFGDCVGYLRVHQPQKSAFKEWNDNADRGYDIHEPNRTGFRKEGWNAAIDAAIDQIGGPHHHNGNLKDLKEP